MTRCDFGKPAFSLRKLRENTCTIASGDYSTPVSQRLLGALPDEFLAHASHAQTIIQLPANSLRLAENSFEIHNSFRHGDNAWGVQFHPEFSADIMRAYVSEQMPSLLKEGHNVEELTAAICITDAANSLLKRFMTIVQERI
jgi:GMP synthase (glutamine-hydrolysing)